MPEFRSEYDTMPSPLGEMLISSDGEAVSGVWFLNQQCAPVLNGWRHAPGLPVLQAKRSQGRTLASAFR